MHQVSKTLLLLLLLSPLIEKSTAKISSLFCRSWYSKYYVPYRPLLRTMSRFFAPLLTLITAEGPFPFSFLLHVRLRVLKNEVAKKHIRALLCYTRTYTAHLLTHPPTTTLQYMNPPTTWVRETNLLYFSWVTSATDGVRGGGGGKRINGSILPTPLAEKEEGLFRKYFHVIPPTLLSSPSSSPPTVDAYYSGSLFGLERREENLGKLLTSAGQSYFLLYPSLAPHNTRNTTASKR